MTKLEKWIAYTNTIKGEFIKLARLRFLNPDNSTAFAIDNNPKNKHANNLIQDGKLSVNLQNGQRRQADVTLINVDGEYDYNVNNLWYGQQIALDMGVLLPDGTEYYFPQGVFEINAPKEVIEPNNRTVHLPLVDKWANLDGTLFGNLEGIYEYPINTNIFSAIAALLAEDRGNGLPIDNVKPIFTEYYNDKYTTLADGSQVAMNLTPYTYRNDSIKASKADVILGLNTMLAGWIGYNAVGALCLDASQEDITDTDKPILWEFSPNEKQFLGATYTINNADVYNDVIIRGASLDEYAQVAGRAQNVNPASNTNVYMIGRKTLQENAKNVYSNDICQDIALWKLKRYTVLGKSISISSTQMFHLAENNLITVRRTDKDGSPIERHLINGYSIPLSDTGDMTIECTSVNDLATGVIVPLPT